MLYGTKYLVNPDTFGSGISSSNGIGNDVNYRKHGGVKYRKKGEEIWLYGAWATFSYYPL